MKTKLFLFFIFVTLVYSCKISPPDPDPPINQGILDVVWKKNFASTSNYSITPVLYENEVLFSRLLGNGNSEILAYDKSTGVNNWSWTDSELGDIYGSVHVSSNGKYLGMTKGKQDFVLNMETQEKVWGSQSNHSKPRINIIGEYIYHTFLSSGLDPDEAWLKRSKLTKHNWETVFHGSRVNGYPPSFEVPVLYEELNGDSILIFQDRSYHFDDGHGKIDLYALNINTNTIKWKLDSITPSGNSSIQLPLVDNDRLYFQGVESIYCFDIPSGERLWERELPGSGFTLCNMVLAEGKLIVNGVSHSIYALDPNSGQVLWENEDTGSTVRNMEYYNGHVFFTSGGTGQLFAVQVSNGVKKWAEYPPGQTSALITQQGFTDGLIIDQESGYLYTNDIFNYLCIKIPDDL